MESPQVSTQFGVSLRYEKPKKSCLITGISGQDGSILAEQMVNKGYEVHGIIRRSSTPNLSNLSNLDNITLHYGDLCDDSIPTLINELQPYMLFLLGAQSDVRISFDIPEYTCDVDGIGVLRCLEAVRNFSPYTKVYCANSSEQFGNALPPQNEDTVMIPQSPYAAAKLFAYNLCNLYRKSYGLYICCGILFNHEQPGKRGENFVTRKITKAIANIKSGKQNKLYLGNLDAKRDWGLASEYCEAMYLMMRQNLSDNYVIATGEAHTVKEFLEIAFEYAELDWHQYVEIDQDLYRPSEVNYLLGDASKAKRVLSWEPKTKFTELVKLMVDFDLRNSIAVE